MKKVLLGLAVLMSVSMFAQLEDNGDDHRNPNDPCYECHDVIVTTIQWHGITPVMTSYFDRVCEEVPC